MRYDSVIAIAGIHDVFEKGDRAGTRGLQATNQVRRLPGEHAATQHGQRAALRGHGMRGERSCHIGRSGHGEDCARQRVICEASTDQAWDYGVSCVVSGIFCRDRQRCELNPLEQSGADANERRPVFDADLEVAAHAER